MTSTHRPLQHHRRALRGVTGRLSRSPRRLRAPASPARPSVWESDRGPALRFLKASVCATQQKRLDLTTGRCTGQRANDSRIRQQSRCDPSRGPRSWSSSLRLSTPRPASRSQRAEAACAHSAAQSLRTMVLHAGAFPRLGPSRARPARAIGPLRRRRWSWSDQAAALAGLWKREVASNRARATVCGSDTSSSSRAMPSAIVARAGHRVRGAAPPRSRPRSSAESSCSSAPSDSASRSRVRAPTSGTTSSPRAGPGDRHLRTVASLDAATARSASTSSRLRSIFSRRTEVRGCGSPPGRFRAPSTSGRSAGRGRARRRRSRRCHARDTSAWGLVLDPARDERVLDLQVGDRTGLVGAADGFGADLREPI